MLSIAEGKEKEGEQKKIKRQEKQGNQTEEERANVGAKGREQ